MPFTINIHRLAIIALLTVNAIILNAGSPVSDAEYQKLKKAALNRPRTVMMNNDACDSRGTNLTADIFLSRRTSFTPGIVNTLIYCVGQGGFQQVVDLPHGETSPYLETVDVFQWLIDFARANGQEVFCSFRMNDVHDWRHTEEHPQISRWKQEHRDCLFGKTAEDKETLYGFWTAMDFERDEVRNQYLDIVNDVLQKYDVDGLDFDFSRYLPIFKRVSMGTVADDHLRGLLTSMFRKIRKAADAKGKERGRAILISVVLPDSIDYCRDLGADIETWMKEGLIDIWQQPEIFRLNTYHFAAETAHKYNVKYYPQVGYPYPAEAQNTTLLSRLIAKSYYAKNLTALESGVDGLLFSDVTDKCEITTFFNSDRKFLRTTDKRYFVTDMMWEIVNGHLVTGETYSRLPQISSRNPAYIAHGIPQDYILEIGDDREALKDAVIRAYLERSGGAPGAIEADSGGKQWKLLASSAKYDVYEVPFDALSKGANIITLKSNGDPKMSSGLFSPFFRNGKFHGYLCRWFKSETPQSEVITEEGLRISDTGKSDRDIANVATAFNDRGGARVFEFDCKVIDASDDLSVCARGADGLHYEIISLHPNKVKLLNSTFEKQLNGTEFHRYRLVLKANLLEFFIDNELVYKTDKLIKCTTPEARIAGAKTPPTGIMNTSSFIIGSLSGPGNGTAVWNNVATGSLPGSVRLNNFALEVTFPHNRIMVPKVEFWSKANDGTAPLASKNFMAELEVVSGAPGLIWIISDGRTVVGWEITNEGHRVYQSTPIGVDISGTEPNRYFSRLNNGFPALYKNGVMIYQCPEQLTIRDGLFRYAREFSRPEEFLNTCADRFTDAEKETIRNGGSFVKNCEGKNTVPGKVISLKVN